MRIFLDSTSNLSGCGEFNSTSNNGNSIIYYKWFYEIGSWITIEINQEQRSLVFKGHRGSRLKLSGTVLFVPNQFLRFCECHYCIHWTFIQRHSLRNLLSDTFTLHLRTLCSLLQPRPAGAHRRQGRRGGRHQRGRLHLVRGVPGGHQQAGHRAEDGLHRVQIEAAGIELRTPRKSAYRPATKPLRVLTT